MLRVFAAALVALSLPTGTASAGASPLRVTLRAENHHPQPRNDPSWQWGYCVRVRNAAGRSVASTIRLRLLEGVGHIVPLGIVSLHRGYDHWCASIGGEDNVLLGAPRGRRIVFQAVVTALGVTVTRSWPLVVRA